MWIFEPNKFAAKSEDWLLNEGYMQPQKARMEFAIENALAIPEQADLEEVTAYIAEETGIQLTTGELEKVLSLYPIYRGKLASYGWGDTELREMVLDVIANFMANTRWPIGQDDVDIQVFVNNLKIAARFMGYSTTNKV